MLLILAVAVGAGLLIALRGLIWLPDALVRAGVVDAVRTPLVFACALLGFAVAGAVIKMRAHTPVFRRRPSGQ